MIFCAWTYLARSKSHRQESTDGGYQLLGDVSDVLNFGLDASTKGAADLGLAGAEAVDCSITW